MGCAKDQAIVNPYDNVNNVEPGDSTIYFSDSTNFASLYNHVFLPYCANSGCHGPSRAGQNDAYRPKEGF